MRMYILVCLGVLFTSCSSQSSVPMENRTYAACVDENEKPTCDGYCYQGDVCVKKFLGICLNKETRVIDKFQMTIPQTLCQTLFDMNFVLKVRVKPI